MAHPNHPNHPYSLLTEHGRVQSHAHSPHGAFLVTTVEQAVEQKLKEVTEQLELLITNQMAQVSSNCLTDHTLHRQLQTFNQELGLRDRAEFNHLLLGYGAERADGIDNFQKVLKLVKDIRKLFNIGEEI
jgi:hypothetical protein